MTESSLCVRWGILGTANIARKNIRAIYFSQNNVVRGIASRSIEKAREYIVSNRLKEDEVLAFGSYQECLDSTDIDAVYIPLPTVLHLEWVVKAAERGKHVLGRAYASVLY